MTRFYSAVALSTILGFPAIAHEQSREPSLDELEMEYLFEQASQRFYKPELEIEEITADFRFRCLRAIGDTPFCECLVGERPYTLYFDQYIRLSARTKSELGYESLSDNSRRIVDEVFRVRDECVGR